MLIRCVLEVGKALDGLLMCEVSYASQIARYAQKETGEQGRQEIEHGHRLGLLVLEEGMIALVRHEYPVICPRVLGRPSVRSVLQVRFWELLSGLVKALLRCSCLLVPGGEWGDKIASSFGFSLRIDVI